MNNPVQQYLTSPKVPSLPAVAMQVLELTRDENVEFAEMATVIENDQALAAKVLRTVNSSYYGLSKRCDSIKQAMVYLGINAVKTIVLGFSLVDAIDGGDNEVVTFDYIAYWQRSLFAAVAARELAVKHQRCDPDVAFLGGLVYGVGQVAMFRVLGDKYLQALDMARGDLRILPNIETQSFDVSSAQVGAALAESWKFPESLVQCIAYATEPGEAEDEYRDIARTVGLANVAAATLLEPNGSAALKWMSTNASRWFDFNGNDLNAAMAAIKEKTGELAGMFRIKNPEPAELDRMLHEAESQMASVQARIQKENDLLRQRVQQLESMARIDPVTGVAREEFLGEILTQQLRAADEGAKPFALLHIRIDDFANTSQRLGEHDTGVLLHAVGSYLVEEIGIRGMVTRLGNDAFAVVVNVPNLPVATSLADHIRNEVRSLKCKTQQDVQQTVSIGLACYEAPLNGMISKPAELLDICSRAIDAATEAGADSVRVFKPARKAA